MSDIKFKFWDSINSCWCDTRDYFVNADGISMYFGSVEDDPVQLIGLTHTGVEIYSGDIVDCWTGSDCFIDQSGTVVSEFSYNGLLPITCSEFQEVIGNKFENPELLPSPPEAK